MLYVCLKAKEMAFRFSLSRKHHKNIMRLPNTLNVFDSLDFMSWTGNSCEPGFCVNVDTYDGVCGIYDRCSTLKTVVNRNAMAMANGKWWIVDEKDNDVSGRYPNIASLLQKPNPLQTWSEFEMQLDVYRQIYGEVFIYATGSVGFSIKDSVSALWVINPSYINIELKNKLFMQSSISDIISNIYLTVGGERQILDRDKILHIKDVNQNMDFCPTDIRGKSRLVGLGNSLKNIIQAEEAIYAINKDRGALGALTRDPGQSNQLPSTPTEKANLEKLYQESYGIHKGQWKILLSSIPLKWQSMTFNVKDLMLIEGMDKNIQLVSSAFGYPYEMLGVMSSSSLNSNSGRFENEMKKMHYQDTIIPIANIYAEKLTGFFGLENDKIIVDFSGVEAMQTSESDNVDVLSKKIQAFHQAYMDKAISLEEYRLGMGYDEEIYGQTMYDGDEETDSAGAQGAQGETAEQNS